MTEISNVIPNVLNSTAIGIGSIVRPVDLVAIGDSITQGFGETPYTDYLSDLLGVPITNLGVSGATVQQIIEDQLLKAVGVVEFDFRRSLYLWADKDSILSIDDHRMVIENSLAGIGWAELDMLEAGVEYTVSGIMAGDGTANPVLVDNGFGPRWTGTSSTNVQEFSETFTALSSIIRVDCRGGTTGNKVYAHGIKIERTDQSACAKGDIIFSGGLNDIGGVIPAATTQEGYILIWDTCRKNRVRLVHMLCTPWGVMGTQKAEELALNDWIIEHTQNPIVDPSAMGDLDYRHILAYSLDGLHFNSAGNEVLAGIILDQIYTVGYNNGSNKMSYTG